MDGDTQPRLECFLTGGGQNDRMTSTALRFAGRILMIALVASPAISPATASSGDGEAVASFRLLAESEALTAGLPPAVADAVMAVESGYDPTRIGGVGEIGLMQVRPSTAAMLGFRGSDAELAKPAVNIHYGVAYLATAWHLANGDLCRALMKYRAGHNQEVLTPLSVTYCARARAHLALRGSPLGEGALPVATRQSAGPTKVASAIVERRLRGSAFWAAHDRRVQAISRRIEQRWRQMAASR